MYLFIFFTELFYQPLWENKWKTKPWIPDVGCIYITNHMRHFRQLTYWNKVHILYLPFSQQLLKPHLSSFTISIFFFCMTYKHKPAVQRCFVSCVRWYFCDESHSQFGLLWIWQEIEYACHDNWEVFYAVSCVNSLFAFWILFAATLTTCKRSARNSNRTWNPKSTFL